MLCKGYHKQGVAFVDSFKWSAKDKSIQNTFFLPLFLPIKGAPVKRCHIHYSFTQPEEQVPVVVGHQKRVGFRCLN